MERKPIFKEDIYTEALIETSAEKVWNIIKSFDQYEAWNIPLLISGQCVLNAPLKVLANIPGRKPTTFIGRLLVYREKEELEYGVYNSASHVYRQACIYNYSN